MQNNRNFYITIALSVMILALWQMFYMNPKITAQREVQRVELERVQKEQAAKGTAPVAGAPGAATTSAPANDASTGVNASLTREAALAQTQRVKIETPSQIGRASCRERVCMLV